MERFPMFLLPFFVHRDHDDAIKLSAQPAYE